MLVYPEQENVVLEYHGTQAKKIGIGLTIIGILIIVFLLVKNRIKDYYKS